MIGLKIFEACKEKHVDEDAYVDKSDEVLSLDDG